MSIEQTLAAQPPLGTQLRSTLIAGALLSTLGLGLLGAAWVRQGHHEAAELAAIRDAAARRDAYLSARAEDSDSRRYAAAFASLLRAGAVGEAGRPLLIDALESALPADPALVLGYGLRRREQVSDLGELAPPSFSAWRHVLEVTLAPRHEEHLIEAIEGIAQRLSGLSAVDACTVRRAEGGETSALTAVCRISQYTFEPSATPGSDPQGGAPDSGAGLPRSTR